MTTTQTRTAECGCTITGRFITASPNCPIRIAWNADQITGSQVAYHNRRVAKEAKAA